MNFGLNHFPYAYRCAALVLIFAVIAFWDWRRHGAAATRWKEYSFLFFAATLGGLFGMAADLCTSHLSPEYFALGKGLEPGPGFLSRVLALGFQAGFIAGAIAGACYLYANNPKPGRPTLSYRNLISHAGKPLAMASVLAVIFGVAAFLLIQPGMKSELDDYLPENTITWFRRVWFIHLGVYLGLLVGTTWGVLSLRRERRRMPG